MSRFVSLGLTILLVATVTARASAQVPIGAAGSNCFSGPDADGDGISNACELALAKAFSPTLIFDPEDPELLKQGGAVTGFAGRPAWIVDRDPNVDPHTQPERVRIIYLPSYLKDDGTPQYGFKAHSGDTEFVVVDAQKSSNGEWHLAQLTTSSHHRTLNHGTTVTGGDALGADGYAGVVGGAPRIYVASGKHGNWPSVEACEAGLLPDVCKSDGIPLVFPVAEDRNLGSIADPLLDADYADKSGRDCAPSAPSCNKETYWTCNKFCGWQDNPSKCVEGKNRFCTQLLELLSPRQEPCEIIMECCRNMACDGDIIEFVQASLANRGSNREYDPTADNEFCQHYITHDSSWSCQEHGPLPPNAAATTGDPHLITFDGLRYDLQAVGELVLVRDNRGDFEVQVRTAPWGSSTRVAVNKAVAVRIGKDRLGLYVDGTVRVNGATVTLQNGLNILPDKGSVYYSSGSRAAVVWPDGSQLAVSFAGSDHLDARLHLSDERKGHIDGLLGNLDGDSSDDLTCADGTVLSLQPSFEELYGSYAKGWRLAQDKSLFDYAPGTSTETFTDLNFPLSLARVQDLTNSEQSAADAACVAAGVPNDWLDSCKVDVGFTGDTKFVDSFDALPTPMAAVDVKAPQGTCNSNELKFCGGACINPLSNPAHCGTCDNGCSSSQVCTAGVCTVGSCPQNQAMCGSSCIPTDGDLVNCGGCGIVCPSGQTCQQGVCQAPPSAGGDIVVFNDMNIFDNTAMQNANNVTMVRNLVKFDGGGSRSSSTVVWMDYGRSSRCIGTNSCGATPNSTMFATIQQSGLTVTSISSTAGSLATINANVKVIFLWNPTVGYSADELGAFRSFASQGGRIVFVGEHSGYYGNGIAIENTFLVDMGALMRNTGGMVDCGYQNLPEKSLRPHEITAGMNGVRVACASVIVPGPHDYPLFYDSTNSQLLAGIAAIDTTQVTSQ